MITMVKEEKTFWGKAQEGERAWWGDCTNTLGEELKQITYAEKMGLERLPDGTYDLEGKSVLDIGGGPVSLLLKCKNVNNAAVVDPMCMPQWVYKRYENRGIRFLPMKGEQIGEPGYPAPKGDEVWIYNVLLHTEDPKKVIEKAKAAGKLIRIFEWINTVKNEMHPHVLTKEQLDEWLGCDGTVGHVPDGDSEFYSAVVDTAVLYDDGIYSAKGPTGETGTEKGRQGMSGIRHKRFHLLGLPHVATNKKEALACAFSQKVVKMAQMLMSLGHTVFFYGVEGSEVECNEFVQVSSQDVLKQAYGDYDMTKLTYKHAQGDLAYQTFNHFATVGIKERMEPNDFLLVPFCPQRYQGILDALDTPYIDKTDRLNLVVEMGIGYRGTQCRYQVFESISQMHFNYGLANAKDNGNSLNGNPYHAVIPNYFDPDDFEYSDEKSSYYLYLGRIAHRKGLSVAIKTCEAIGAKLKVAGQIGDASVDLSSPCVEFVGFADVKKRKELMRRARALFLPTFYIEPFGGVIIEAAFSGTPVITSNWGAFPELVRHGKTGYRCATLDHYVWAAKNIGNIKPIDCYDYAMSNFSLDRVRYMYEEYFNMLLDYKENVNGEGWHRINENRTQLDWLQKY